MRHPHEIYNIGYRYEHTKYKDTLSLASSFTKGGGDKIVGVSDFWGYTCMVDLNGFTNDFYLPAEGRPPHKLAVYSGRKYHRLCYYNPRTGVFFDFETRSSSTLKNRARKNFKVLEWDVVELAFGSLQKLNDMLNSKETYPIVPQILLGL